MSRLTRSITLLVFVFPLLTACGRDSTELNREEQQYEVVQEGAASGVTSTIVSGGETPQPLPPSGTGVDTTTTFTLGTSPGAPTGQQPGNLAGTLPQGGHYPSGTVPRPRPAPVTPAPQPAPVTPAPQPEPATPPAPAVEPAPTPTETQPAEPAEQEEPADEPEEEETPPAPPPGSEPAPQLPV
jgi:hypothetical protein